MVIAQDWDEDLETGIPYGPSFVHAIDQHGRDFPLTEKEIKTLTKQAVEMRDNSNPLEMD